MFSESEDSENESNHADDNRDSHPVEEIVVVETQDETEEDDNETGDDWSVVSA